MSVHEQLKNDRNRWRCRARGAWKRIDRLQRELDQAEGRIERLLAKRDKVLSIAAYYARAYADPEARQAAEEVRREYGVLEPGPLEEQVETLRRERDEAVGIVEGLLGRRVGDWTITAGDFLDRLDREEDS